MDSATAAFCTVVKRVVSKRKLRRKSIEKKKGAIIMRLTPLLLSGFVTKLEKYNIRRINS